MSTKRKTWVERAIATSRATPEANRAADALVALALAPVKPTPFYGPVQPATETALRVTFQPVDLDATLAPYAEAHAALRAYLTDAHEWGPMLRVAALVQEPQGCRAVVIEGRESAIRATFPDELTLGTWADARATAMPVVVGAAHPDYPGAAEARWVPIAWAPCSMWPRPPRAWSRRSSWHWRRSPNSPGATGNGRPLTRVREKPCGGACAMTR